MSDNKNESNNLPSSSSSSIGQTYIVDHDTTKDGANDGGSKFSIPDSSETKNNDIYKGSATLNKMLQQIDLDLSIDSTTEEDANDNSDNSTTNPRPSPREPRSGTTTKNDLLGMNEHSATSNMLFTIVNLCNMIIGSGVIVLPNALSSSGIVLGVILLAWSAILTDFSILALAKSGALTDKFTYQSVVKKALGFGGIVVISACQIIYPIFAVVSYSIGIRQNFAAIVGFFHIKYYPTVEKVVWYVDERFLLAIVTFSIIFPLASMRNISKLDKASFCSVLLVFVYIGCVTYKVFVLPKDMFFKKNFISYGRSGFVSTISVFAFALSCQHNVLPMFRSMRGLSVKKFGRATHYALSSTTFLYTFVAVVGYVTFTGRASGNLLKDYCTDDPVILVARLAFSFTVILTSPLQIYSCREAITTLVFKKIKFNIYIYYAITFGLVTLCFFGAVFIDDIEDVINLSGSLVAAPVVYILPALSLLRLMKQGLVINNYTKVGCVVTCLFGVFVLVVGTGFSIYQFIHKPPPPIRYWCIEKFRSYSQSLVSSLPDLGASVKAAWGITNP